MYWKYPRNLFVLIALLMVCMGIASADSHMQTLEGRIVVFQYTAELETYSLSVLNTDVVIDIAFPSCYALSPSLTFLAVREMSNPESLRVYNLGTGELAFSIVWDVSWDRDICGYEFQWRDNTTYLIPLVSDGSNVSRPAAVVSVTTGQVIGTDTYDRLSMLPNRVDDDYSPVKFSPDGIYVVYQRCADPVTDRGRCTTRSSRVIWNMQSQEIVADLQNPAGLPVRLPLAEVNYSWSPSGQYLAYRINPKSIAIYDVVERRYLDLQFLYSGAVHIQDTLLGMVWSPDESRLLVSGNFLNANASSGLEEYWGMALIDLHVQSLQVFDFSNAIERLPLSVGNFAWADDHQSVLIVQDNHDLVRYEVANLDHPGTLIASNIYRIESWWATSM